MCSTLTEIQVWRGSLERIQLISHKCTRKNDNFSSIQINNYYEFVDVDLCRIFFVIVNFCNYVKFLANMKLRQNERKMFIGVVKQRNYRPSEFVARVFFYFYERQKGRSGWLAGVILWKLQKISNDTFSNTCTRQAGDGLKREREIGEKSRVVVKKKCERSVFLDEFKANSCSPKLRWRNVHLL